MQKSDVERTGQNRNEVRGRDGGMLEGRRSCCALVLDKRHVGWKLAMLGPGGLWEEAGGWAVTACDWLPLGCAAEPVAGGGGGGFCSGDARELPVFHSSSRQARPGHRCQTFQAEGSLAAR